VKTVKPHPRTENVYMGGNRPLLAKVPHLNGDYLPHTVKEAFRLLGGLEKSIRRGDRVMIKPNFNCPFALPLSTDLAFLAAVIEALQEIGAKVTVGELSGRAAWPTEEVIRKLGVERVLKRYNVPFVNFQYDEWLDLLVNGTYWDSFRVPRSIYEAEKRVYLANMRCHSTARFTASLKLSVGWIGLDDRDRLHIDRSGMADRIPELNLGWQPNVILIDGRRSTVSWHGRGNYVYPNVVMASGDMVAIDAEAVRILKQYPGDNRLNVPLQNIEQLRGATAVGLGTLDASVVEAPARTATEQQGICDNDRPTQF